MAYVDLFDDVFSSYYVCEGCGLKVPAQMLDRCYPVKAPDGHHEVGVVDYARGPVCRNPRCPGRGEGTTGFQMERVHADDVQAYLERLDSSPDGDTNERRD